MIKVQSLAFVGIPVTDIKRARGFYEGVLGLKPNSEYDGSANAQWVEYDIGAATIGIGCAPGLWEPSTKGAS